MGIQCTYKNLQCAFSEKGSFIHHKEFCIECWNQRAFVLHTRTFSVSLPGTIYVTSWSVIGYNKQQVASDFGGRQNEKLIIMLHFFTKWQLEISKFKVLRATGTLE